MDMNKNSDLSTPSASVADSHIAHEIPAIDEVASAKIEKLDRHGTIDHLETPPSKRIKSSPSKNIELNGRAPPTQPEEGAARRERQKGVAPIKAESVIFQLTSWSSTVLIAVKVSCPPTEPWKWKQRCSRKRCSRCARLTKEGKI